MRNRIHNVVRRQVEVASQAQLHHALQPFLQLGKPLLDHRSLIRILVAGVRRANNMRNAVARRLVRHLQRSLQVGRPVVHSVNQMVMNIDHCFSSSF